MTQQNDTTDQEAFIHIETASKKIASTILQALRPEIHTSNLGDIDAQAQRTGNILFFHFKSNNTATLRALINSYLRWCITLQRSLNIINPKNSSPVY